jgi:hypothetical protein
MGVAGVRSGGCRLLCGLLCSLGFELEWRRVGVVLGVWTGRARGCRVMLWGGG